MLLKTNKSLLLFSTKRSFTRLSKKFLEENKMILNKTNYYVFPLQKAPERWRLEPFVKDGVEYNKRGIFQDIIAQIKQSINLKLNTDALTLQTDLSEKSINLGAAISLSTFYQVLNGLQLDKSEDSDFNFSVPVVIPTGDPNAPAKANVNPDALFGRRLMQIYSESLRELRKNDQLVEATIERVYPNNTRWSDARLLVTAYRKGEPQQMKMRFLHNEIKYVVENSSSEKDSAVIEVDIELFVDLKFNVFHNGLLVNTEEFKNRPIIVTLRSNDLDVDVKPQTSLKLKDMIKWTMIDLDYVVASTIVENKKAGAQFSAKVQ
jgi:hypothetical protein